jgi:hypothetical protein
MAARLPNDVILHIFGYLYLSDVVSLMFADVLPNFTTAARELALPVIADFDLQVDTVYDDDGGTELNEFEHMTPVIRHIPDPTRGVLPKRCVIFEPELARSKLHRYHRNEFKPVNVILRWRQFTYNWVLRPDYSGPGRQMEAPMTNLVRVGGEDSPFIVFQYWHEEDVRRESPIKVFYKSVGDTILLHCVSIPISLLTLVLEKNCRPGDWRYSI